MPALDRITSDPNVLAGQACIRGMRISVALIAKLSSRMSVPEILDEYPDLEPQDIEQAVWYAALRADERLGEHALGPRGPGV